MNELSADRQSVGWLVFLSCPFRKLLSRQVEASLGAFGARGNDDKTVHQHADSSPSIKLQIACSLRDQIDELKQICAAKVRV